MTEIEILDSDGEVIHSKGNPRNPHNFSNIGGLLLHVDESVSNIRYLVHFRAPTPQYPKSYLARRTNQFFVYYEGSEVSPSSLDREVEKELKELSEEDEFQFGNIKNSMLLDLAKAPDATKSRVKRSGIDMEELERKISSGVSVKAGSRRKAALLAKWTLELEEKVSVEVSKDKSGFKNADVSILIDSSIRGLEIEGNHVSRKTSGPKTQNVGYQSDNPTSLWEWIKSLIPFL